MIRETVRVLEQFNIVKAVTSGRYKLVTQRKTAAPDRIIAALHFIGRKILTGWTPAFCRSSVLDG